MELFTIEVRTDVIACRGRGEATCILQIAPAAALDPSVSEA
jgi:hypothetical protein